VGAYIFNSPSCYELIVAVRDTFLDLFFRCLYVSGIPGTGKTVVVQAVMKELGESSEKNKDSPFQV
jgi:Cdc6-like AAA superfamily ATPase